MAVFDVDVVAVVARPAMLGDSISVAGLRELGALPGPSPHLVAALVPAVVLLVLAAVLRRVAVGAPPLRAVSPEALAAAERTMGWAVRVVVAGAVVVFLVPLALELVGIQAVSLTTNSMAPAFPAGSLVLTVRPADPSALRVGDVVVIGALDGSRVTHRIMAVVPGSPGAPAGASVAYRTRGDAAATMDPEPVPASAIEASVVGGAPALGAMRAWMASPLGIATGLILAWAFIALGALLGDARRRALAAGPGPDQAVASSTSLPTA
jgi:signal peptidase I